MLKKQKQEGNEAFDEGALEGPLFPELSTFHHGARTMLKCDVCKSTDLRRARFRSGDVAHLFSLQLPVRCRACRDRAYRSIWRAFSVGVPAKIGSAQMQRTAELPAAVDVAEAGADDQVFAWRRYCRSGELAVGEVFTSALLPAALRHRGQIDELQAPEKPAAKAYGSIHVEFPGGAFIKVESGADERLLRTVLQTLRG